MPRLDVAFDNPDGKRLVGLLDLPEGAGEGGDPADGNRGDGGTDGPPNRGVVLCSHFTGFKELTHLHRLATALADRGIAALRFDYSDCIGESEGGCEDMAVTHQVRDTLAAMDHLRGRGVASVGLFGHSLGGLTAAAAGDEDGDVAALVLVGALAKPEWDTVFSDRAKEWAEQGHVTFPSWKRGEVRIAYGFYQDLQRYDAADLVGRLEVPVLVVHAEEDTVVPRRHADALYEAADEPKALEVIAGADHLFSDRDHEDAMIEVAADWFERWL